MKRRFLFLFFILSMTFRLLAQPCSPNSSNLCVSITQQENLLCWGRPTGVLGATGYGVAAPSNLQYWWSNGANTAVIGQLAAGTYTVTVTDAASGQSATASATLTQPQWPITLDIININPVTCTGAGSATVTSWGGTGNHTYLWSQGATTATAHMTIEGHYSLTVTDANGCTQKGMVNMPGAGTYETFELPVICAGESHTRGGQSFTQQGLYSIAVPAPNGCDTLVQFYLTVLDPTLPLTHLPDSVVLGCAAPMQQVCAGPLLENGAIAWWKDDISYSTEACITISAEGQYRFASTLFSDDKTCTAEKEIVVTEHLFSNMSVQAVAEYFPICVLDSIQFTYWVASDVPLQQVVWLAGTDTLAVTDTLIFKTSRSQGLPVPAISASATDIYGCQRSGLQGGVSITLTSPLMIFSPSYSIWNCSEWMVQLHTMGGQYPLSWQWSNGATGAVQSLAPSAQYSVTVTDALGCTDEAIIATNAAPYLMMEGTPAWSATVHNGIASADLIGISNWAVSWLWSNGATTHQIAGLPSGEYCVTVTDNQGCTYTGCYSIEQVTGATQPMAQNTSLLWYPNPVQAGETLCLSTASTESLQWRIINPWGGTVLSGVLPTSDRCVTLPENMPEGVYQLITENRHFFHCNKIFLQKPRY